MEEFLSVLSDKDREKLKKFDIRGVQTLCRNVSRNHYNLLKMVDNKASIILTINSIMISLVMGIIYVAPESERAFFIVATQIFLVFCMASMIIALFSMLPYRYQGKSYKDASYTGLLYAESFATISQKQFKEGIQKVMMNGENLYNEIFDDIYYMGKALTRKQKLVHFATLSFIIGLLTMAFYIIISELTM
ncbi:MAG: Pycsar system effector family protein [Bacteroidota bacterium]